MRPIRLVAPASAVSRTVGSRAPPGRYLALPHSAGPSARKIESKVPRSAVRARFVQYARSRLADGSLSGSRQAASWWPQLIRNALKCSCRSARAMSGSFQFTIGGTRPRPGQGRTRCRPHPAPVQFRQHSLAEPVRLLQVRVPGQDELLDAQRGVLLDQVGDLLVAPDERGTRAAADQPDPGPQVRVDLQVAGRAA